MELTRNTIKWVKSLQQKKFRREFQVFVVEGEKSVLEVLGSGMPIHSLYGTSSFLTAYKNLFPRQLSEIYAASEAQLTEMGSYSSNDSALAVVELSEPAPFALENDEFVLVLDDIRDPGNLGTMIRTADWFGVRQILCSKTSVEWHNPKVISASMGSFTRVHCHYADLLQVFNEHPSVPRYGAVLDGNHLSSNTFAKQGGFIIIGNEANGIASDIDDALTHRISIPRRGEAESLNAAIACGILLSHLP